jgi:glutamine synthetase adenylyltransferase
MVQFFVLNHAGSQIELSKSSSYISLINLLIESGNLNHKDGTCLLTSYQTIQSWLRINLVQASATENKKIQSCNIKIQNLWKKYLPSGPE